MATNIFQTPNLANKSVTLPKLGDDVLALINASGGGTPADAFVMHPHLFCTGTGKFPDFDSSGNPVAGTGDPWVSASGTGGLQELYDSLPKNGDGTPSDIAVIVDRVAGYYKQSVTMEWKRRDTTFRGVPCFFRDPNAESMPRSGSLVHTSVTSIRIGIGGPTLRLGGIYFEKNSWWGPTDQLSANVDDNAVAIEVVGCLDQPRFSDNNVGNMAEAFAVTDRNGGGNVDTGYFTRNNFVKCGRPAHYRSPLPSFFNIWFSNCLADNNAGFRVLDGPGYPASTQDQGFIFIANEFVRGNRLGIDEAGLVLMGCDHTGQANMFRDMGLNFLTNQRASTAGICDYSDNSILINNFIRATSGPGIRARGKRLKIVENSYIGSPGEINNGRLVTYSAATSFSTNTIDIVIESMAEYTTVNQQDAYTFSDAGKCSVHNNYGTNPGDPDSVLPWSDFKKKWPGLHLINTAGNVESIYHFSYPGGRRDVQLASNGTLAAPTNPALMASGATVATTSWAAVANATTYVVQLATDSAFSQNVVTVSVSGRLSQTFTGLTGNTTYYTRVKAQGNGYNESPYSATATATTAVVAQPNKLSHYSSGGQQVMTVASNDSLAAVFTQPFTVTFNHRFNDSNSGNHSWVLTLSDGPAGNSSTGRRFDILLNKVDNTFTVVITDPSGNYILRQWAIGEDITLIANYTLRWNGDLTTGNSFTLRRNGMDVSASSVQGSGAASIAASGVVQVGGILNASTDGLRSINSDLDNLRIVNIAITDAQIAEFYPTQQSPQLSFANNIVAQYNFDGSLNDETGQHNGTAISPVYVNP